MGHRKLPVDYAIFVDKSISRKWKKIKTYFTLNVDTDNSCVSIRERPWLHHCFKSL